MSQQTKTEDDKVKKVNAYRDKLKKGRDDLLRQAAKDKRRTESSVLGRAARLIAVP